MASDTLRRLEHQPDAEVRIATSRRGPGQPQQSAARQDGAGVDDELVFETNDLGEMQGFLARTWENVELRAERAHTHSRIRRVGTDGLTIDDVGFGCGLRFASAPPPLLCVCFLRSGQERYRWTNGVESRYRAGDVFAIAASDLGFEGELHHIHQITALVDPALLATVAEAAIPSAPTDVRITSGVPVSTAASRQLLTIIAHLRFGVLANPEVRRWPLLTGAAKRLLAMSILETFPSNAITDARVRELSDSHPALLRRAIAYIETSAGDDVTIADIAVAARVSPRSVQAAFRRHLDTTPTAYLRRVRLSGAHQQLQAGSARDRVTISQVAHQWGFGTASSFAADYRAAYGCSPSQTQRA